MQKIEEIEKNIKLKERNVRLRFVIETIDENINEKSKASILQGLDLSVQTKTFKKKIETKLLLNKDGSQTLKYKSYLNKNQSKFRD